MIPERSGGVGELGFFIRTWDRLVASDPGLTRLQMALSSLVAVASTIGIEAAYGTLMHRAELSAIVNMLLGAIVSMMGTMALAGTTGVLAKARVAAGFPIALAVGLVVGTAVSHHTDLMLGLFVVIMFLAVAVRRFGQSFFFYGFMAWMGYFFASFLHATFSMIPSLLVAILIATAWVVLLSTTVLRTNPERSLRSTVRAYRSRARAFAGVCAELLRTPPGPERDKQLRRVRMRHVEMSEAALIIEGWSAQVHGFLGGSSVRRYLLDAQQALDRLAYSAEMLLECEPEIAAVAARAAESLSLHDDAITSRHAREVAQIAERYDRQTAEQPTSDPAAARHGAWRRFAANQFAQAAIELAEIAIMSVLDAAEPALQDSEGDPFEPVVGLAMGNLPGSAAIAADVPARGALWNPLARLSMPMRQAIQVAIAGGLAILAGRALSPVRYYWAVIAAFIMFTGTATRSETFLKGFNRVIGTLGGLVAAIGLADLTAGHTVWVLVVVFVSIFCGFYLQRVSYAYMIFFITIMVGQLYSILHELSAGLLLLRLEETAIGAVIGFGVALAVTPLSTRDTIRSARNQLLSDLAAFLDTAADRIGDATVPIVALEAQSRTLDNRLQQLLLVARPLTQPVIGGSRPRVRHRLWLYASLTTGARALTVALREPVMVDASTLVSMCRALGEAAQRLRDKPIANQDPPDASLPARSLTNREDPVADPVTRRLLHVQHMLSELGDRTEEPL